LDDVSIGALAIALTFLILLSAFFSASEIGMMALNRYRLKHLAESGHQAARIVHKLLERPDRVLGIILLGNNFANLAASAVTTIMALKIFGEASIAVANNHHTDFCRSRAQDHRRHATRASGFSRRLRAALLAEGLLPHHLDYQSDCEPDVTPTWRAAR
jgi:hypothetical protein